jgi:type II secretory pathway component PulF
MPAFAFRATDVGGTASSGEIEAGSREEVYRILRQRGLRPVSVNPVGGGAVRAPARASLRSLGGRRLSGPELLDFTEELAELLDAGLQLEAALGVMANRAEGSVVKAVSAELRNRLRDGISFSRALRECGGAFDPLYCNMVAAGETAGALPKILRSQCAHLTLLGDLRSRVASALLYPSIVFVAAIGLMFVFLTFLVPQLAVLLQKTGQELPLLTKGLIAVSMFTAKWWWAILAGLGASVVLIRMAVSTPGGRAWWHRAMLDLPAVGAVLRSKFYAEVLQTLSTLVSNGVNLLQGLKLLVGASSNVFLRDLLEKTADMVGEGRGLSSALRRAGFFPPVLVDILAVGEQTGDISGALARAAKRYDRDLTARIERLTTLIQPAIILIVGIFVLIVAYSMISGILTSVNSLRPR